MSYTVLLRICKIFFFTAMYGNGMLLKSQWGILYNEISFFQRPKLEICPVPGQICRKSDEYFGQFIESRNRLLLLCCVMFIRINHCALSKGWSLMGSVTVPAMYPRGMESNGTFFCCLFFFFLANMMHVSTLRYSRSRFSAWILQMNSEMVPGNVLSPCSQSTLLWFLLSLLFCGCWGCTLGRCAQHSLLWPCCSMNSFRLCDARMIFREHS